MSGDTDKKDNDFDIYPDNTSQYNRVWLIEWRSKLEKTLSEEKNSYTEALEIFNEKTKDGKDIILYEIRKSNIDGKILKKIPILNSSKSLKRKRISSENRKEDIKEKKKVNFSSRKSRIIILLSVIAGLLLTLYIINIITSGGSSVSHHMLLDKTIYNYDITANTILTYKFFNNIHSILY